MATNLKFDKFAQEAHEYINDLAKELGHPEEKERSLIVWRSVMHTIRDRIHIGESLQLLAPLPTIFKGIYVEDWKYNAKPPLDYDTVEEMKAEVKKIQQRYGEQEFNWSKSTEDIISTTVRSLKKFMHDEQLQHLKDQMPRNVKELF